MANRRFPPPWSLEEPDAVTANQPMTVGQVVKLRQLAEDAYELDAFKPNLTRAEAGRRIAALTAKLKLLDGPPHTEPAEQVAARRFPPPWSVEDYNDAYYIVRDRDGQALAYVYYEQESGRRSAAKLLTKDEARRIAANVAKLPELLTK